MKQIKLSKYLDLIFETPDQTGSWFGYYNYDTLNSDQSLLLSHRTNNDAQKVRTGMTVEVGYYNLLDGSWTKVAVSDSYNWQQGSMSQWIPGTNNRIIFNTSQNGNLVSHIVDIKTGDKTVLDWPIYGITPDGRKSITIDLERSYWCRAYHYESVIKKEVEGRVITSDGIYSIDLIHNTRQCIIPISKIIATDSEPYFDMAKHWLEHIMISPNGKRFCFLHRFTIGKLDDYETRLFIANIDGSNLQIVKGWRNYYWSHFGWNGDDNFAIYASRINNHARIINSVSNTTDIQKKTKSFNTRFIKRLLSSFIPYRYKDKIRKLLFGQNSYYQYYGIKTGAFELADTFDESIFSIDGHPSFTNDGRYMITDSYPDEKGYQRLIVFDIITRKSLMLGTLYAGLNGKDGSCDLHPKLCKNNDFLAVDSAYNGSHHILLFKLNWIKIINKISK